LFFESRLALAEAVLLGYQGGTASAVRAKIDSALEYTREMLPLVRSYQAFVPIFGYSQQTLKVSVLERIEEELDALVNFDESVLIRHEDPFTPPDEKLAITDVRTYPSPLKTETTFIYELSKDADEVSILIYTASGRRVRALEGASAQAGYNETFWDGRDETGSRLANGVYLFRIRVQAGTEQLYVNGRLAVLR